MRCGLFFQAPNAEGPTRGDRYAEMVDLLALAGAG
jgi:hypothetical protein